jgi:putative ABC transport system substrate-binding protein
MIHRRTFLMALVAVPASAAAHRRFRIGWLVFGDASMGEVDRSLKDALVQRGLIDGGNIEITYRYANGAPARLPELASELVAQKPDLLLAVGGDVIKALFDADTSGIPIVGGVSDSPVRAGIAASLARPGKNFTGFTYLTDEMAAKRISCSRKRCPIQGVAVIFNPLHLDDELTFARRGLNRSAST